MRKIEIIYRFVGILALGIGLVCSCSEMEKTSSGDYTISASFGGDETRVSLEALDDLSLLSKWNRDEKFDLFVNRQEAEKSIPIGSISEDGKNCTFSANLSEDTYPGRIQLFCATATAHASVLDGKLLCNASLVRSPLSDYYAPVLVRTEIVDRENISLRFSHFLVYELLHITNESDYEIRFSLTGFESPDGLWYYSKGAVDVESGTVNENSPVAMDPVSRSSQIVIPSGGTDVILSAYRANGKKISNAKMLVEVNGKPFYSSNTLSSNLVMLNAHAYHMYAAWTGTSLVFLRAGSSEIDAGGSGYGTDSSGNISGIGLGFGSDSEGNITGGGSGYGSDESGALSGGGSGYSNGN